MTSLTAAVWRCLLIACLVLAISLPQTARADHHPGHVDGTSGSTSFFVEARDGLSQMTSDEDGHDGETADSESAAPTLPPCGGGQSVGACEPVTTCWADESSPTGFSLLTSYGYSAVNSDFSIGPPCTPAEAARESLPALVLRAFREVPLPQPVLSIQPPKGKTLVGLETIFSTKAEPFTRTLHLLGRRVELRIKASNFAWDHGDGTTRSTDWAGKAWDHDQPDIDGYLTHVYEHTGTVRPRVSVTWSAEYRVDGAAWQTVNGTVTRDGAPAELVVVEGKPVLNAYR